MKVLAAEIMPDLGHLAHSGEEILVQGVVDCCFIENDELIIVDYKTDKVNDGNVLVRAAEYKIALEYYARGLSEMLEMPVAEKYLYFFENGALVDLNDIS